MKKEESKACGLKNLTDLIVEIELNNSTVPAVPNTRMGYDELWKPICKSKHYPIKLSTQIPQK
ncbi:10569_t:CDS:2 [Gigaspora margarita]|uniref:10569_t:CDS:1 n=1 Tax=Gigaspora margarita TaxID=4874 RepID=A0ABN7UWE7_GIGMA|nr:10569_t:CDS:2 [Gigaspora margarita]